MQTLMAFYVVLYMFSNSYEIPLCLDVVPTAWLADTGLVVCRNPFVAPRHACLSWLLLFVLAEALRWGERARPLSSREAARPGLSARRRGSWRPLEVVIHRF